MREDAIRVAKRCPVCNQRLFDKISLTTGFVEIKCPQCKHVVRIDLAMRMPRHAMLRPSAFGAHPR